MILKIFEINKQTTRIQLKVIKEVVLEEPHRYVSKLEPTPISAQEFGLRNLHQDYLRT